MFHIKDIKGMHYLAELLRHPNREIASIDLIRAVGDPPDPALHSGVGEYPVSAAHGIGPLLRTLGMERDVEERPGSLPIAG